MSAATPDTQTSGPPWAWPPLWVRRWRRADLSGDLTAGVVVAVMLVPQSLAYAMLAGLPPHAGLLASILPLVAYALFGDSRTLSVGPAAITSLMVAHALAPLAPVGTATYLLLSAVLALASGLLMMVMGVLRMGFLSQLMSQPVVQGFTVASALLILLGQWGPLMGWGGLGHTLPDMLATVQALVMKGGMALSPDAQVGLAALFGLWLGPRLIQRLGARAAGAAWTLLAARLWPLVVLVGAAAWAWWGRDGFSADVKVVGALTLGGWGQAWQGASALGWVEVQALALPVLLVSLVGFVSSMSVAQTFALKHSERVDADRELLGLGLANVGSAALGGLAVAGGLSRTVVNEAAGARSPLAGIITASLLVVLMLLVLPALAWLPKSALAAVIIMAVINLVTFQPWRATWAYDRADAGAFACTLLGVLLLGFEVGLLAGLMWSLAAMVWRHSQPHMAEVGRVPGTEHFRNVGRHQVEVLPGVLMVRVDESLDFTNIQRVEQGFNDLLARRPGTHAIVVLMSAVNHIDHTALSALSEWHKTLSRQGIALYLTDIKGPVMDRLQSTEWMQRLQGHVFLSAQHVWAQLSNPGATRPII